MTWGMVAIGGALAYSAYSGKQAAGAASAAQVQGSERAAEVQKEMFDKQVELQAPFREAGLTGQNKLMDLLGLSGRTTAQGYGSAAKTFCSRKRRVNIWRGFKSCNSVWPRLR